MDLKVEDYYPSGKRFSFALEKKAKEKELPVHHKLEELLDQYLKASGLENEPGAPLFPAALGKTGKLSRRSLVRTDAADMLKRRLKQAGLPATIRLTLSGRPALRIFWKMTAPLKPLSESPGTPTAGPPSFTIAVDRKFSWRTWNASGTDNGT